MGFIYAIESGDAVKIGYAADPVRRLSELNVGSPGTHRLLGFITGTKAQESEAHILLRRWRVRGEWFRKEGAVLAFLALLPTPAPKPIIDKDMSAEIALARASGRFRAAPACNVVFALGGPNAVGAYLGIHRTRVSNWMRPKDRGGSGGIIPTWHVPKLLLLARELGVGLSAADFLPSPSQEGEAA